MPDQTTPRETAPSPINFDALERAYAPQRPQYPADVHEAADRVARIERERRRADTPATGITRLDIPFWDVFCLALKFFIAQALISAPLVLVIWLAFVR